MHHLVSPNMKISIFQLLVRPTGGEKTLLSTAAAVYIEGITLCIYPLLICSFDQYQSLIANTTINWSITSFHLNELSPHEIDNLLLPRLTTLPPSLFVILFTFSQCMLKQYPNVLKYLFGWRSFVFGLWMRYILSIMLVNLPRRSFLVSKNHFLINAQLYLFLWWLLYTPPISEIYFKWCLD